MCVIGIYSNRIDNVVLLQARIASILMPGIDHEQQHAGSAALHIITAAFGRSAVSTGGSKTERIIVLRSKFAGQR